MTESEIPPETITRMVQHVEPTWRVAETTAATEGAHLVYHLGVETDAGRRRCVLKATPPDQSPSCDGEARLLAILDAETDLPVPEVFGAVDEHEAFQAPYFLMSTLPGTYHPRRDLPDLPTDLVAGIARSTGRHLAHLHRFEAVDAYGYLTAESGRTLDGGRPAADPSQLTVHDPIRSWPDYLDAEIVRITEGLAETRFSDLAETVRAALEARVEVVTDDGEVDPVVARIDQSLDNVLVDPETGDLTGLLDWEFCVAATPAYDLAFVEHTLLGGHWRLFHGETDLRSTIQSGLLDGYAEAGPARVVDRFRAERECYATVVLAHELCNFDAWFDQIAGVSDDRREAAAQRLRGDVDRRC
ncbi:phosphotransferase family protein [Halosimplex amylolyticum]|uniref:phosphotransferase family protein n=1 Tax=Halosimplex amylolyticum TaxID=3396616 RepID=UPI003F54EDA7